MKIDLNADSYKGPAKIYDICVVGTGPAGMTLALEMARAGKTVALFEGGDMDITEESQDIYNGENIGREYYGLEGCRLRYFGGTSGHWGGLCHPLAAFDFERRDYFDLSGWPISKADLDDYIARAHEIFDLGDQTFDPPPRPKWNSPLFERVRLAQSPPTRFGEKYRDQVVGSDKIDLFVNANLVDMRLNDGLNHVTSIKVKNFKKDEFDFSAKRFALCCGAVENARLLLNFSSQVSVGIGNHSDFVGRCFMEHLNVDVGGFVVSDAAFWKDALFVKPRRDFSIKEKIANVLLVFGPNSNVMFGGRLGPLKNFVRDQVCKSPSLTDLARELVHFYCPGDGLITTLAEQSPNRESRVTLYDESDALGLRRVRLNWQINDLDKRTIRRAAIEAAKELTRLDLARVQFTEQIYNEDMDLTVGKHCHQMGTTRMASLPKDGVVDGDCKVFGIDNLYLGGSGVFSTGGGVNPTFSIVQLALRLSDHLKNLA